jgi:hypothetical protein
VADDDIDAEFVANIMEPMVEAFTGPWLMQEMGTCRLVDDHDSWCASHDSLWMPGKITCARMDDLADITERAIVAWETRHGR